MNLHGKTSAAQAAALAVIQIYKHVVSPWLPPSCRFTPTCSEYAVEAIRRYGVCQGTWKALRRLGACHPLHHGGYDPVN